MKILGNLILTIVITLLAFGCGLGEEEEMNKQRIDFFNETVSPVALNFYQDTTYTIGAGIKVDSMRIGLAGTKSNRTQGFRLDQTVPTSYFKGTRVEVLFLDGKRAYYNLPNPNHPRSIDSLSLKPYNPINQPFVPVSVKGRTSNYRYVLKPEVYQAAR
ncbi:MAG: hypothetical protein ACOVMN_05395 [Flexibacteraceae bacterium]